MNTETIPHEMLEAIVHQITNSGKYAAGSGVSFLIANAVPDKSLLELASAVTGWGLALVCIFTLGRTVKFLFTKIQEKDTLIQKIFAEAEQRAEKRLQEEIDKHK
jgi:hypothetical protein